MKDNALSIANYFIELARKDNMEIKPLRLMKLVYIAHGHMLAMMDRSVLDPRFDKVEAWKYGPVVPSVYHSFKHFKDQPITEKTVLLAGEENGSANFVEPMLQDEEAKMICKYVWNRYKNYSDSELVTLLHRKGSPWETVYRAGENVPIPDEYTRVYYRQLVDRLLIIARNEEGS